MDVVSIYFPSWHPDAHYAQWYGQGFSEWEILKSSRPLFPGHHQPKEPLWGFFDESDPCWMARQIDHAADYGINVFLFDWYWYQGERFLEQALERGFLQAANCQRLKFSLMWANHTWGSWPALDNVPGMASRENQGRRIFLRQSHDIEDLDRLIDYCVPHYFNRPNYWRLDDRPVFAIYDVNTFINLLGGEAQAAEGLARMHRRAQSCGLPGLYFIANIGCCDDNLYCCGWNRVLRAKALGFERVFAYNIVRSARYASIPEAMPVYPYEEMMDSHRHCWNEIEKGGLPHMPVVTVGCDVTPRWHRDVTLPMKFREWQYEPIAIDNTPEKFGTLCREALARACKRGGAQPAILLNAWNEWTEGMYLLPEKKFGNGYLEALRDVRQACG